MNRIIITFSLLVFLASSCLAHPAWGIIVDRYGQVYFSDAVHNVIWRIDTLGMLSRFVTGKHAHDLFMDAKGFLYAEHVEFLPRGNQWRTSLWKISPGGKTSVVIRPTISGRRIWYPFTFDSDGNLYAWFRDFSSKKLVPLMIRQPDGTMFAWSLKDSSGRSTNIDGAGAMVWGPHGHLYLTSGDKVLKVSKDGVVTTVTSGLGTMKDPELPAAGLWGLTVDAKGNIYIAEYGARRVIRITPDGKVSTSVRSEKPWSPTGVVAHGDDLYVLEDGLILPNTLLGPRVRKVTSDGKVSVVVVVEE